MDMDIWEGLRTPAHVGMHPLGLQDLWTHYAASNVKGTRRDGSANPMAVPETFEEAKQHFRRAVILSAMVPLHPDVFSAYAEKVERGDVAPFDYYARQRGEVETVIGKALEKAALNLMRSDRAVIPMTNKHVDSVTTGTRGAYLTGKYHGPMNVHWPQNSVAVMTGLLRFGANRVPFRDEIWSDGSRKRLMGRYFSMVIFDTEEPRADEEGGVTLLTADRLAWLRRLSDYTDVSPEVVAERYCTYNGTKKDGDSICGKCLEVCPSGALSNSTPQPDGSFPEEVARQKHRFWGSTIDFDAGNCCNDRGQKAQLYSEYVCAHCETTCAACGIVKGTRELETMKI